VTQEAAILDASADAVDTTRQHESGEFMTAVATLSDGTSRRIRPAIVAGRRYLALAVPAGVTLTRVSLADRSGHVFAAVTAVPAAG
jgi:hypothetical protein